MFDSLLGGKFSKKCKHCIKCISSRVVYIRKKRQATVRFLKKDVSDLLATGHDLNAFGRMEALIVEINHTSCYDMIEQHCQCILNQLRTLQKQRECPKEAMEAVSTLIFAAARFSDLPELSDLRGVFTERYGSHMEPSVNAEFVEKFQKKSFTLERKLQLMKDIAEEFSVRWDSKAFQQKLSNPHAPPDQPGIRMNIGLRSHSEINGRNAAPNLQQEDQPKIRKNIELRSHSEINGRNAAPNQQKEVAFDAAVEVNGRNRPVLNAGGSFNVRKEAVFDDDRNRAFSDVGGAANSRKETVFIEDAAVNGRKEAIYCTDKGTPSTGSGSFSRRKEEVLNVDIALHGRRKSVVESDVAVSKRNDDQQVQYKERWEPPPRSSVQKQQVHPEPKDIHVIPIIRNGQLNDPSEKTRKFYPASKEPKNVEPVYDNAAARAYAKDMGTQNEIIKDVWLKSEVSQNEGITRTRSPIAQDGPGLIGLERRRVGPVISRGNKFKGGRNEGDEMDSVPFQAELSKSGKGLDPLLQPVNSKIARPMSMIPPPYTKPNFKNPSSDAEDTKLMGAPINISSSADYETSNGSKKAKSLSVRRRHPKLPPVIETNNPIDTVKPVVEIKNGRYADETVHQPRKKAGEEIHGAFNQDRNVHGMSKCQRKHGGRRSNAMYDGDCDEDEEVMDRLLLHLSKKGVNNDSAKSRTRTRAPHVEEIVADATRDDEHYANGRSRYQPKRVASLPPEPRSPVGRGCIDSRGPFRAISKQPDMLSHNGANPRIPDYEDLKRP